MLAKINDRWPLSHGNQYGVVSVESRFWEKVDASGDCWEWLAFRGPDGYGRFWRAPRKELAHRISWELLVGKIPPNTEIDHLCRNRGCVNPDHLETVSHRENVLRGSGVAARHALKTHCPHGHPYPPYRPGYKRKCARCHAIREAARGRRQRREARERGSY